MVAVGEKQPLLRLEYDHGEESIDGVSVALDLKGIEVALMICGQSGEDVGNPQTAHRRECSHPVPGFRYPALPDRCSLGVAHLPD
jgi:hypothetical protein